MVMNADFAADRGDGMAEVWELKRLRHKIVVEFALFLLFANNIQETY